MYFCPLFKQNNQQIAIFWQVLVEQWSNACKTIKKHLSVLISVFSSGADYEARTRYLHLGKVALYQMS